MTIWIRASPALKGPFHSLRNVPNTFRTRKFRTLSTMSAAPYLLTAEEVKSKLGSQKIVPMDVSWFMPGSDRKPAEEFNARHVPGARFLNLDEVADKDHPLQLKHMMPNPEDFAKACCLVRLQPFSYDSQGIFSAPRALFMFRSFGHSNSSILNGGLPIWEAEGYPVENTETPVKLTDYPTPSYDPSVIKDYKQMTENAELNPVEQSAAYLVIDARPGARFTGAANEPRPGLSSGHMPHSFSVPFNTFLQANTHPTTGAKYNTFLPAPAIREALVKAIGEQNVQDVIDGKRSITTSCGSGMTAGILWLGLKLLGVQKPSLYDESWTGYAMRPETSKIIKDVTN